MLSTGRLRLQARKLKIFLNQSIATVAPLTRIVPTRPRQYIRDWLIKVTTPGKMPPYRAPIQEGKIHASAGINEYGFFRAQNGLAQGAKSYALSLKQSGVPFTLVNTDFLDWLAQDDHSLDELLSPSGKYAINLIHINAEQFEDACRPFPHRCFDNHYNIGVWLWELDKLPDEWVKKLTYVDELWAPSRFIADAIRKVTDKPVTTIPYGIETPAEACGRADFGFPESDFLALAMYDSNSYASRKNPDGAIDAFIEAFRGEQEDVALVLKIGNSKPGEREKLEQKLQESGIRYFLVTERMSKARLNAMIACCDVFLSLHRSEGFGLVVAEAMSLGTPVIATGWSANAEFMPDDCTCRIGYHLMPVGDAYQFAEPGQMWAEPDIQEAAAALRMLREKPERAQEMAEKAQAYIHQEYSLEQAAKKMKARYQEICEELREQGRM